MTGALLQLIYRHKMTRPPSSNLTFEAVARVLDHRAAKLEQTFHAATI